MIKELNENTALKLRSLNEEEKKAKGVLGRLYGPVASFAAPTRNGRKYTQQLWEKLFESDLIKERFANGGIFGQLCHPDYSEVDMEKIACVMPEPPVKDKDGNLIAYVDLIDTPCGRIAYQLAKYGYKFGISSRGEGDLIDGPDGEEVDPDTYQLNAFDLVEIPAVENARLTFTESLDKKRYNKTLRQTLQESLDKADDKEKVIMNEALNNLGINLDEEVNEATDPALKHKSPTKGDKPFTSKADPDAVKRVFEIFDSMTDEEYDALIEEGWKAYIDNDPEAKAFVKKLFKKYHLPMWALKAFEENWDEQYFDEGFIPGFTDQDIQNVLLNIYDWLIRRNNKDAAGHELDYLRGKGVSEEDINTVVDYIKSVDRREDNFESIFDKCTEILSKYKRESEYIEEAYTSDKDEYDKQVKLYNGYLNAIKEATSGNKIRSLVHYARADFNDDLLSREQLEDIEQSGRDKTNNLKAHRGAIKEAVFNTKLSADQDRNGQKVIIKKTNSKGMYLVQFPDGEEKWVYNTEIDESVLTDLQAAGKTFRDNYGDDAYNAYQKYAEENPDVYDNLYGNDNIDKFLGQYKNGELANRALTPERFKGDFYDFMDNWSDYVEGDQLKDTIRDYIYGTIDYEIEDPSAKAFMGDLSSMVNKWSDYVGPDQYDSIIDEYEANGGLQESAIDRYAEFNPEDAELHMNTDWKARNYEDLPVPDDSFEHEVVMYRKGQEPEHKNVKFIKHIRSNPIYPPYYAPEENPFEDGVGPMYDGKFYNMYDIHDRYEDQYTYDRLSESRKQFNERLISTLRDSQKLGEGQEETITPAQARARAKAYLKNHKDASKDDLAKRFGYDKFDDIEDEETAMGIEFALKEACNNESCSNKDAEEVVNDKSDELVAEFQEALLKIKSLEEDNLSLQERLSVCNAKENKLQEQLDKYKKATVNLSESAKAAKSLNEEKEKLTEDLNKQVESSSKNKARINSLVDTKKDLLAQLKESKAQIEELNNQVNTINEQLESNSKQLEQSNKSLEKYRKSYKALKENYLDVKADLYGIKKSDIKANLNESYTIKDVDSVCKELSEKKQKLSKLPFVVNENTNIAFKKSKNEYIMNESLVANSDDYVSESLLQLANLK